MKSTLLILQYINDVEMIEKSWMGRAQILQNVLQFNIPLLCRNRVHSQRAELANPCG